MKKILSYAVAAILLGTVTMLVPAMLLESIYYGRLANGYGYGEVAFMRCQSEAEKAVVLDGGEAFGIARFPSNLLSAGLMLIPSFLLALGVSLYLKKRIF